jgi:hypothetical protein
MAKLTMVIDDSSFLEHAGLLGLKLKAAKMKGLNIIANELLRLSQLEVPFVSGELMNSGVSRQHGDEYIVGYNKVYAAYMHEGHWHDGSHHIKNYSNNRKGKYLEDPMKINKEIFNEYFGATVRAELGMI